MKILLSEKEIQQRVKELAGQISQDYQHEPIVILCVLRGAFIFCADLVRHLKNPLKIDFISLSSYGNETISSGKVKIHCQLREDILNQHVLIVEDIVDTGVTLDFLKKHLATLNPKSIKIATFLSKPARTIINHSIDYLCFEVPDQFVVGYGLDAQGLHRELPYLAYII